MPVESGDLTLGGILYEGCDFKAWQTRMDAVLRTHNLSFDTYVRIKGHRQPTYRSPSPSASAKLMCTLVHHSLLARIPEKDRNNAYALWPHLEKLSRPFRFSRLPPEVRNMVYRFAVANKPVRDISKGFRKPAVALASRKMANEALPILLSSQPYFFNLYDSSGKTAGKGVAAKLQADLKAWAAEVGPCTKHLRRFQLTKAPPLRPAFSIRFVRLTQEDLAIFTFAFSTRTDSLTITAKGLSPESQKRLDEHVAWVNEQSKIFALQGHHMQGELIVFAITSKPELWQSGTLKWAK